MYFDEDISFDEAFELGAKYMRNKLITPKKQKMTKKQIPKDGRATIIIHKYGYEYILKENQRDDIYPSNAMGKKGFVISKINKKNPVISHWAKTQKKMKIIKQPQ